MVGTYGRVWGHVVGCGACGRGGGRVWGHVTRGGGMWYGVRPIAWTGTCGRGGPCGMVWGHVAGCGVIWQVVGSCGRGWRHVTRVRSIWQGHMSNVKKSKMFTMNEVHNNFNLTQ